MKNKKLTPKQQIKILKAEIDKWTAQSTANYKLFLAEAAKVNEAARLNKQTVDEYNKLAARWNAVAAVVTQKN